MNIDLLLTRDGQAGLLSDTPFEQTIAVVLFDPGGGELSLEFKDMNTLQFNIGVEEGFARALTEVTRIHMGVIVAGQITDSALLPLVVVEGGSLALRGDQAAARPARSVMAFDRFLRQCSAGQPVHRDDLGNENSLGAVMGGGLMVAPQFSPQLARQKALEAAPRAPAPAQAPSFGPGGMGGGGGGVVRSVPPSLPSRPPGDGTGGDEESH